MSQEIAAVLEICLNEIAAGRATIQDCQEQYPDLADELAPLLWAAERARDVEIPHLDPEVKARIEARLLTSVKDMSFPRPKSVRSPTPAWRWMAVGLVLLFIFACFSTVGLVGVSSSALPGSPLYSVKLATEEVWLWLAPGRDEPALHLRFAQRRLTEIQKLAERGRFDAGVLLALSEETAAALAGIETLPPEAAQSLLMSLQQMTAEQEMTLTTLLAGASAAEQDHFTQALRTSSAQQALALQLADALWSPDEPGDSGPAMPTASPVPPVKITRLPRRTPEPSGTPTTIPSPTATSESTRPVPSRHPTTTPDKLTPTSIPPEKTASPTETPHPTKAVEPTSTFPPPTATATDESPAAIVEPTETPRPTATAEPPATFVPPTVTARSTETPHPISAVEPTATATTKPSETPQPTEAIKLTDTPIPPTTTPTPARQGCVYGHGYWKNQPDLWPASSLTLGNEIYIQTELLDLLDGPTGGDASLILAQQLIAARLNVANGADDSAITDTLASADTWLAGFVGRLPYDVKSNSPQGREAVSLADILDQYNNGILPDGPSSCP